MVAVVLAVVLASCSHASIRAPDPEVRAHFRAVRAALDEHREALWSLVRLKNPYGSDEIAIRTMRQTLKYKEALWSIIQSRDPYGSDGIAAIRRMRQTMEASQDAAEPTFVDLGPGTGLAYWYALAAAVERHVKTAGTVLSQALPKLKKSLRQHRPVQGCFSAGAFDRDV